MRIAYVSLHWPRTLISGVGKKILRQISAWTAAGHEVQLFMHSVHRETDSPLIPGEVFYYPEIGGVKGEWGRITAARRLLDAVKLYRPDVIYLRYGMYIYPIHRLIGIAPVVEDVTTNDIIQHKELGVTYALYNRMTRGFLLRHVKGLVTISKELAYSPVFSHYGKPTIVIANGIDLENFQPLPAPANTIPRLVFMGNPTAGFAAHGIDKLIKLAELCPDIQIDVIGYDRLPRYQSLPTNITFHGYMSSNHYQILLANSDVAVSSLAFHRVGMQEQSPLKSREYLAYGLPMVVPYIDTDLNDLKCDFLLNIPNREDNIQTHAEVIRDFAYRMRGRRVDRQMIMPIDQTRKETERLRFFEEIIFTKS